MDCVELIKQSPILTHALTVAASCGTIMVSLLGALASEVFLKRALYIGLKRVASKTKNTDDDELVRAAGKAWGLDVDIHTDSQ